MLYISMMHYQGARRAYFALNPELTDADWERWLKNVAECKWDREGDYEILAELCRRCLAVKGAELEPDIFDHIVYAAEFFENPSKIYFKRKEIAEKRIVHF